MKTAYWGIIFAIFTVIGISIFFLNGYFSVKEAARELSEHEYLIKRLDNLSANRDKQLQQQKIDILNNMTHTIVGNQKIIIAGQQAILDNISALIKTQNLTVVIGEHSDARHNETLYAQFHKENQSIGKVSGFGKPVIIQ